MPAVTNTAYGQRKRYLGICMDNLLLCCMILCTHKTKEWTALLFRSKVVSTASDAYEYVETRCPGLQNGVEEEEHEYECYGHQNGVKEEEEHEYECHDLPGPQPQQQKALGDPPHNATVL